jgi:hypothetical protein
LTIAGASDARGKRAWGIRLLGEAITGLTRISIQTVPVFDVDDDAPGGPEVGILSVFADETRAKIQALAWSS